MIWSAASTPRHVLLYEILALCFAYPSKDRLKRLRSLLEEAVGEAESLPEGLGARVQDLARAAPSVSRASLEAEYHALFAGEVACSPHETEYGPARSLRKGAEMADIAGFYRAFGVALGGQEVADHISAEMEFLAFLAFKEGAAEAEGWWDRAALCRDARRSFLQDHPGRWLPTFCNGVEKIARQEFYRQAARCARSLLEVEARALQVDLSSPVERWEDPRHPCQECPAAAP